MVDYRDNYETRRSAYQSSESGFGAGPAVIVLLLVLLFIAGVFWFAGGTGTSDPTAPPAATSEPAAPAVPAPAPADPAAPATVQ